MEFMKTEQEQIEQIEKVLKYSVADYKHLKKKGVCYCYAETLIDCGYGDVSEYKAERKMLGSQIKVLKQRLNNKYVEIEQLKAKCEEQDNEIDRLECVIKENDERCFDCPQVKRVQIDILNKAKERLDSAPNSWAYMGYIDELIEEIEK